MRIRDLTSVNINWKMLTLARPANKMEEAIFTRWVLRESFYVKDNIFFPVRLVQLEKQQMTSRRAERAEVKWRLRLPGLELMTFRL